jgi:hypothetical protein
MPSGHNHTQAVSDRRHVLDGPGEYEIGGCSLSPVSPPLNEAKSNRNVLYLFDYGGLTIAHLG